MNTYPLDIEPIVAGVDMDPETFAQLAKEQGATLDDDGRAEPREKRGNVQPPTRPQHR